ncbi:hypothetical protein LJR219_004175 [Phenylobacterium sp. LjRoot219]|uniref:hypothetical protein n=1 Tax=Phenylobacterium sp. LjRoot219 TaxID=3342283 RepID=UPI003ECC4F09
MRALLLAIATVSSLAAAAPTLAQTFRVNNNLSIDVTGFSGDPKTLPDAVTHIESLNGGRVAAITFNNVAGTPGYGVIVLKGSDVRFWRLDTPTGQAVELTGASVPSWMLTWRNQRRAAAVQDAKISLADAIRTAEASQQGAPAVVAGIARNASNPDSTVQAYMVGILKDGRLTRVAVDSQSGSRIENPEVLDW